MMIIMNYEYSRETEFAARTFRSLAEGKSKGLKAISRKTRKTKSYGYISHRSHKSHEARIVLLACTIRCANTRRGRQARAKRRAICEIREICVKPKSAMKENFAFFARFA